MFITSFNWKKFVTLFHKKIEIKHKKNKQL